MKCRWLQSEPAYPEIIMPSPNKPTNVIHLKIVYYGPPQSGKRTNLQTLQRYLKREVGGSPVKLHSLATKAGPALRLHFLPLEAAVCEGYRAKISLYTAPGDLGQQATRQLVLKGVTGIVFVADSRYEMMTRNLDSLHELEESLVREGLDARNVPCVLQYNKRDLPGAAPKEFLDYVLNRRRKPAPSFSAVALQRDDGVFSALNAISRILIAEALKHYN